MRPSQSHFRATAREVQLAVERVTCVCVFIFVTVFSETIPQFGTERSNDVHCQSHEVPDLVYDTFGE